MFDDRSLRVPRVDLDGNQLPVEEFLRIREVVDESDARTINEINALIQSELEAFRERKRRAA